MLDEIHCFVKILLDENLPRRKNKGIWPLLPYRTVFP